MDLATSNFGPLCMVALRDTLRGRLGNDIFTRAIPGKVALAGPPSSRQDTRVTTHA